MSTIPTRICSVEGCNKPHKAKGFCNTHYARFRTTGRAETPEPAAALPGETWRPAIGFEGVYEVSDQGRVRRIAFGMGTRGFGAPLKQWPTADGHLWVRLASSSRKRQVYVHRLVMAAFVGPLPDGHVVHHRNADPANNHVSNLEYVTPMQNSRYAVEMGRSSRGESHPAAQLSANDVLDIRARFPSEKASVLAEEYGIHKDTIYKLANRVRWKHL